MGKRKEALWRLLLLIPLVLVVYVGSFVFAFVIVFWFILDILWQLIFGSEGLSPDGFVGRLYDWTVEDTRFVLLGDGEWRWLP